MSITPSPVGWQTHVSDLPWAGGHFVPVGWAKISPETIDISSKRETRGTILSLYIIILHYDQIVQDYKYDAFF